MNYIVAIPSYDRSDEITKKTLPTLKKGKVNKDKIYVFVANKEEEKKYREKMDKSTYNKIVVGKKGIVQQRKFISQYFSKGTPIVSMDDDVRSLVKLSGDKLKIVSNLDSLFKQAFKLLKNKGLYLWGVYPVKNAKFMKNKITTNLKFIIGVVHGYINRHDTKLYPNLKSTSKEDIEQSVLFFMKDKGVLRYNHVSFKTKWNDVGGLGTDRFQMNKDAQEYLCETYPQYLKPTFRKSGSPEVRFSFQK